ncbi:MAG: YesL family protein [Ruminococcus sp.]|nr:YesL family protein [Ruminococcus sp.]
MAAEKNISVALTNFFNSLFSNFSKLLFTNILFAVPFAVCVGVFYLINHLSGLNTMFIQFLAVIPLFPFYAGITQVTSHMVRGENNVDVWNNFIGGIKENFLRFLVHGIVLYIAFVFSYFSISIYSRLGGSFYVLMVISIIIALLFLFAFFYLPAMTVTFDLSMKHIYKNSLLMTFGELKHNIIATFGLIVLALLCATVLFCCTTSMAIIIATIIFLAFFVPSIGSFIINSAVYSEMYTMIINGKKKTEEIDRKIENRKQGKFYDIEPQKPFIPDEFSEIDVDETKDGDEYIFYNGKMVKRSILLQEKKNKENQ